MKVLFSVNRQTSKQNFKIVFIVLLQQLEGARASTGLTLCVDVSSGESYK